MTCFSNQQQSLFLIMMSFHLEAFTLSLHFRT
jgi:hypothetical protein